MKKYVIMTFLLVMAGDAFADSVAIIKQLRQKTDAITSYACDYVVDGRITKRMSFLFKAENKPGYTMRSDWLRNGEPYVLLISDAGQFQYFPNQKTAYSNPKKTHMTLQRAREFHFGINPKENLVIGEDKINGHPCVVVESKLSSGTVIETCYDKTTGLHLVQWHKDEPISTGLFYHCQVGLDESLFQLPEGTKIIDGQI